MAMPRPSEQVSSREHNKHRKRRAKSWIDRSKAAKSDEEKFLFSWIAFNSAYGDEPSDTYGNYGIEPFRSNEMNRITEFLEKIIKHDELERTRDALLDLQTSNSETLEELLRNQYIFKPFWQAEDDRWREGFNTANKKALETLRRLKNQEDVLTVSKILFERLYLLRNQVLHGCVTFVTGKGRPQLKDGSLIMEAIVPAILNVLEAHITKNPESELWGKVAYPRVGENPH